MRSKKYVVASQTVHPRDIFKRKTMRRRQGLGRNSTTKLKGEEKERKVRGRIILAADSEWERKDNEEGHSDKADRQIDRARQAIREKAHTYDMRY